MFKARKKALPLDNSKAQKRINAKMYEKTYYLFYEYFILSDVFRNIGCDHNLHLYLVFGLIQEFADGGDFAKVVFRHRFFDDFIGLFNLLFCHFYLG